MIFKSLFKPKWLHHDAQIRKRALQSLDFARAEDYAVLMTALRSDVDLQVRQSVLKRVVDLDTLWELAQKDSPAEISAAAATRFANLLSGAENSRLTFEQRLQRFALISDAKLIEQMALEGRERELRSAAMQRIEREGLLGDIALKDADVELRVVAVQRIKQKSTLERVAKQARIKDKRVSAIAREKLATLAADEERPALLRQQARQVCITLDALVRSKDWSTAGTKLSRIEADWSAILAAWEGAKYGPLDTELTARYAAGRSAFNRAFAEYELVMVRQLELDTHSAAIRARKQDLCEQLDHLLDKLQQPTAPPAEMDVEHLSQALHTLNKAWSDAGVLTLSEEQSFQLRYRELVARLEAYARDVAQYHSAQASLMELCEQAEALLDSAAPNPAAEVTALEKRYRTINRPVNYMLAGELDRRIVAALNQLRTRCEQQTQKLRQEVDAVKRSIAEMEQALEAGQSQAAIEVQKNVQKLFDALPESEAHNLRKQDAYRRWQAAAKTIRELGSWKRWAGAPVKEHLVAEMESIVLEMQNTANTKHDYSAIAARIRAAREQWKELGATDNAGAKALWERFNTACETAFAPCAVHFEQERVQRTEHGQQKEIICHRLEQFIASTAWETTATVDWKNVEHVLRGARKEWDVIGPLAHKQRNTLNMRFRVAMDDLALRLSAEKKLTQTKKEALIQRMEQLAEAVKSASADSTAFLDAVTQAKQLQSQWKTLGQSAESNALWGKFRAASDALFARRQALHDAKDQERHANLALKQALCTQLEEFAALPSEPGEAVLLARGKVQQLKSEFDRIGPVHKDAERTVLQRFKQACHALEQQDQRRRQQEREQQVALLEHKAQLCAELEQAADALITGTLTNEAAAAKMRAAQETWQTSASLPDAVENHIQARFQLAVEAVHGLLGIQRPTVITQLAQQRQNNLAAQELLCLRLEIVAGLDSPPTYQQQRMQYQVDQLARRMKTGEFQDDGELLARGSAAIKQQWLFIGAVPAERTDELRARFERACSAPVFA